MYNASICGEGLFVFRKVEHLVANIVVDFTLQQFLNWSSN